MFLACGLAKGGSTCFPRVCGDVSNSPQEFLNALKLSPRMRGCFLRKSRLRFVAEAFPAYAGMFLAFKRKTRVLSQLSPRMRGCFLEIVIQRVHDFAFPAYAGMFLLGRAHELKGVGFPRVCGDVSG